MIIMINDNNMYLSLYIYIYMYICVYMCMYVCVYIYIYILNVSECTYTYLPARARVRYTSYRYRVTWVRVQVLFVTAR